jgi:hypothetical protein
MRRNSILVLALGAALAVAVAAVATAKFETFQAGNLVLKVDGGVSPKTLPKTSYAPVKVNIKGKISTKDGTHPAALREVLADFDKNGKIDTTGLPVCKGGQLEARTTTAAKKVCGKSEVGTGEGRIQISFPEQAPIPVKSPITVFNGGTKGGKTTLFIHAYITVPVPSAVVTTVTIKKVKKGRFGLSTVSKIPVIAGGSGSVLDFSITFKRIFTYKGRKQSYFTARCTDGKFKAKIIKALFRNEAGGPRTTTAVTNEEILRPCTPKG